MNLSLKTTLAFALLAGAEKVDTTRDLKSTRKTCKALALRGCGKRAMYQVGVLQGLYDNSEEGLINYDAFAGVSSGSGNACQLAKFPKE